MRKEDSMNQLLATYRLGGELHRIELVRRRGGALVLDRPREGAPGVVAELAEGEGREQALAVLHAGGYLDRARAGEEGLCRTLEHNVRRSDGPAARAA
jgi:hypothetical protein